MGIFDSKKSQEENSSAVLSYLEKLDEKINQLVGDLTKENQGDILEPEPPVKETESSPEEKATLNEQTEKLLKKEQELLALETELKTKENDLKILEVSLKKRELALAEHDLQLVDHPQTGNPESAPAPAPAETAPAPQNQELLQELVEKVNGLTEKVGDIEYKDKLIRDLHEDLRENKKDWSAELSKPFLLNLVKIHQMLRGVFMRFKDVQSEEEQFVKAVHEMENDMLMVQDMLEEEYDLSYFEPEIGSPYMPKEHVALQAELTQDEKLAGTIASVSYGGFRDLKREKIFKQAMVKPYRLEKQ